jgi:hypothetical protein
LLASLMIAFLLTLGIARSGGVLCHSAAVSRWEHPAPRFIRP